MKYTDDDNDESFDRMRDDLLTDAADAEMKKIASHECGSGRYARMVWGSIEDCKICTERKALFAKAKAHYTALEAESAGDACEVNSLLSGEREYVEDINRDVGNAIVRAAIALAVLMFVGYAVGALTGGLSQ